MFHSKAEFPSSLADFGLCSPTVCEGFVLETMPKDYYSQGLNTYLVSIFIRISVDCQTPFRQYSVRRSPFFAMLLCRWNAIPRGALLRSTRLTHVSKPLNSLSFITCLSLNLPPIAHHRCLHTNPPNPKLALTARIVGSLP